MSCLTFIVDGIDDMHRTGKKASPLRLPQKEADVAEFRIRRDATENMLICAATENIMNKREPIKSKENRFFRRGLI